MRYFFQQSESFHCHDCHVSGASALRLAFGARAGCRVPSVYTDMTVTLSFDEELHLAISIITDYGSADSFASIKMLSF